jgi:hypothetical protein
MRIPRFAWLALAVAFLAANLRADANPEIVSLGHDTYALTRWATTGFTRKTAKLKEQALEDAAAYCAKLHKELKVVSTTEAHPTIPLTGFASAKVVFKALDADDPELHAPVAPEVIPGTAPAPAPVAVQPAPPRSETNALYRDLLELDDLRKRGLLTEEEFQAKRKKLVEKSN